MEILTAMVISLLSALILYIVVPKNKYRMIYIVIAYTALLLRLIMVFYLYRNGTGNFGTDGLLYHNEGISIAKQLDRGVSIIGISYSYTWYTVLVGIIYHFFGVSRYLPSFLNCLLALLSGLILLKTALKQQYSFINASVISLAFLYFPNIFLWTTDTRKESLLIFICLLSLKLLQDIAGDLDKSCISLKSMIKIIVICMLMWLGTLVRIYILIPALASIITTVFFAYRHKKDAKYMIIAALAALSAMAIAIWTFYPLLQNYHAVVFTDENPANITRNIHSKLAVLGNIAGSRNLLQALFDSLTKPFPININIADIRGMKSIIELVRLDMMVWYTCLLLEAISLYYAIKKRDAFLIGVFAFIAVYVLINALLVENVPDTIYRYRSVVVALSLLLLDGRTITDFFYNVRLLASGKNAGQYIYK